LNFLISIPALNPVYSRLSAHYIVRFEFFAFDLFDVAIVYHVILFFARINFQLFNLYSFLSANILMLTNALF